MKNDASLTAEGIRLFEDRTRLKNWKRWGPYLSERQWATVREDYSPYGTCWDYFVPKATSQFHLVGQSQRRHASLSFPFAEFLSINRRLDRVEQCIFAERLEQEIHCTSGKGLYPLVLARAGGNKNGRNALVGARQISLQFQAIHSRHPKVED
jgi:hypothetical protein